MSSPPDGLGGWPVKSRQPEPAKRQRQERRVKGALTPGCARP